MGGEGGGRYGGTAGGGSGGGNAGGGKDGARIVTVAIAGSTVNDTEVPKLLVIDWAKSALDTLDTTSALERAETVPIPLVTIVASTLLASCAAIPKLV